MNVIESNPQPEQQPDLKQRFQKKQEERKDANELNLEALSDEELIGVINRGRELWEKRRAEHLKKLDDLDARVNSGASSVAPAKRRGRKPKNNAGD
jgi:hypothetical protein